jgi:hypothetical protein
MGSENLFFSRESRSIPPGNYGTNANRRSAFNPPLYRFPLSASPSTGPQQWFTRHLVNSHLHCRHADGNVAVWNATVQLEKT